jgi:SAM-dependent methyltransferase
MHYVTEVGGQLFSYPSIQPGQRLDYRYFWGGRTSCKRTFLIRNGIFHHGFRFGCEDIELGFRLSRHGLCVVYRDTAVAMMLRPVDLDGFCERRYRQGRSQWLFSTLHHQEEILGYTEVDRAEDRWMAIAPDFETRMAALRKLDRFTSYLAAAGQAPDSSALRHLYRGYRSMFDAWNLKGVLDMQMERSGPRSPAEGQSTPSHGKPVEGATCLSPDVARRPASDLLPVIELADSNAYRAYLGRRSPSRDDLRSFERSLVPAGSRTFTISARCFPCGNVTEMAVDFEASYEVDGIRTPNWRERLVCPSCGLNNRTRAALHIFEKMMRPKHTIRIYLTEQVTKFHDLLLARFPGLVGSEYLGESIALGARDPRGIRNEDLTRLSFDDAEFDAVITLDVMEHIPDHRAALSEMLRCLRPGGTLLCGVPIRLDRDRSLLRARVGSDGTIEHLVPPEYHGNPLSSEGCLAFHHFGWDILDDMRRAGYSNVGALIYRSPEFGYLGADQVILRAVRPLDPILNAGHELAAQ